MRATAVQTLNAHLTETAAPLHGLRADIPSDLEEAILRCLEKDPTRRVADVAALDLALARCACAGHWTAERAATWWSQHERDLAATPG